MLRTISLVTLLLLSCGIASGQIRSVYTTLDQKHCKSLKLDPNEHEVDYKGLCTGAGGYKLRVANFDLHHVLDLITPAGKSFNVGIDSASYNFLGTRAEWRMKNGKPFALIVRYNLIGPMTDKVSESILVVSKISRSSACVIDQVEGSKTQNTQARKLADSAASRPCKSSE